MRTILITDDDPAMIDLVKLKLSGYQYEIITAGDGNEAIQICLGQSPDLVLMDINMPNMNGIEATGTLRSKGFTNPIIILTSSESDEDNEAAHEAGCNGYVLKSDLAKLGGYIDMILVHFM